nr:MAG TPA: hypothetical protein [Caudoviricetes sp.]
MLAAGIIYHIITFIRHSPLGKKPWGEKGASFGKDEQGERKTV